MSYNTWHVYGYGVQTPDDVKIENLIRFCQKHKVLNDFLKIIEDEKPEKTYDIVFEYEGRYSSCAAIASMIADAVEDETGVRLAAVTDYNDNSYLVFEPYYPWSEINEAEKKIKTKKDVEDLILPYLKELYEDDFPAFDYQEVFNGG